MNRKVVVSLDRVSKNFMKGGKDEQVLKEISFKVKENEVVGFYGDNGCGKTSVLRLIAGIIKPDRGSLKVRGKVVSVLELGAGLHPELTGRENVYLYGSILGIRKRRITDIFEKIVEFAGLDGFMDEAIKKYSSGMKARLAFAIAVHAEGEVFLFDEVMAVGDADFRQKCMTKIEELKIRAIVILTSHNLGLLLSVCDRIITLDKGRVVSGGGGEDKMVKKFAQMVVEEVGLKVRALSSSMFPAIEKGQMVIVQKIVFDEVKVGEVVVFSFKSLSHWLIHRVVGLTEQGGERKLITKGDNAMTIDPWLVREKDLVGRVAH